MSIEDLNCIKEFSETILTELGSHYKEHIYVSAMCIHLRNVKFLFGNEVIVPIMYQGVQLGYERADIIIYEPVKCVIEFKAQTQSLSKKELNQLIKYQNNLDIQYGILINFGHSSGKLEYVIWDKSKESNVSKESNESTISAITQGISDLTKTTLVID
jgi:GxxExxY protein